MKNHNIPGFPGIFFNFPKSRDFFSIRQIEDHVKTSIYVFLYFLLSLYIMTLLPRPLDLKTFTVTSLFTNYTLQQQRYKSRQTTRRTHERNISHLCLWAHWFILFIFDRVLDYTSFHIIYAEWPEVYNFAKQQKMFWSINQFIAP